MGPLDVRPDSNSWTEKGKYTATRMKVYDDDYGTIPHKMGDFSHGILCIPDDRRKQFHHIRHLAV